MHLNNIIKTSYTLLEMADKGTTKRRRTNNTKPTINYKSIINETKKSNLYPPKVVKYIYVCEWCVSVFVGV